MKKNIIKMFLLIFAVSMISGCSKEESKQPNDNQPKVEDTNQNDDKDDIIDGNDENTDEDGNQGITVNQIEFEVIDSTTLSEDLISQIETLKLAKGFEYWEQEDGSYLIFISAGEKSTGGYGIEVVSIEDNEGKTVITVKESEPAEDSMNIQVLSYPYVIVKASGITDQFSIHDEDNNEYTRIEEEDLPGDVVDNGESGTRLRVDEGGIDFSQPITGVYQGMADNHTIEVLVDETYIALYADDIEQYLDGIEKGDTVEVKASISPSDQILLDSISEVQE